MHAFPTALVPEHHARFALPMGLFTRKDRDALGTGAAAFAIVALVVALVALVTVAGDNGNGGSADP